MGPILHAGQVRGPDTGVDETLEGDLDRVRIPGEAYRLSENDAAGLPGRRACYAATVTDLARPGPHCLSAPTSWKYLYGRGAERADGHRLAT